MSESWDRILPQTGNSMLVVKGSSLPEGWAPGNPIPSNVDSSIVVKEEDNTCPVGPKCFSCQRGNIWDSKTAKHQRKVDVQWNRRKI